MSSNRHRSHAESQYRQSELRGTVTVIGDIVGPVVPEEQWDSLAKVDSSTDVTGKDDSRSRQAPEEDDK